MKPATLFTLLLSTILSLPAFTQQASSDSSAQPVVDQAASTTKSTASGQPPLQAPTSEGYWDGDDPNVVNLVTHPFARKSYVQRTTGPIHDRLNELDELTSTNSKMIKDVDTRAQQGIEMVSRKIDETNRRLSGDGGVDKTAGTTITDTTTHLSKVEQMVGNVDQYKNSAQTEIRFRSGQSDLSKEAKNALDEMVAPLKDQGNYVIEVRGYAPGSSQAAITTSRQMAKSVVRYLVLNHNIPTYRIYAVGMGNAATVAPDGTTAKDSGTRRVDVSLLKNDLSSSAQPPQQ